MFIFSILLTNSYAQYLKYDLSKYKLPDIKTNLLDLKLFANNIISNSSQTMDIINIKQKSTSFGGLFDLRYYSFINSTRYQGSHEFRTNLQPGISDSKTNSDTLKRNQINGYLSFTSNNRFYNNSNLFFETDPYFSYNFLNVKSKITNIRGDGIHSDSRVTFSLPLAVGYGRLEPVEDARLAIYIIESLTEEGKIINQPSESVITELARTISGVKRKRFFDTRIRKIAEMQTIDSFLVANNIVNSRDMRYFTALNDQWDYAAGPSRMSGFSVNAGFYNNISFNKEVRDHIIFEDFIRVHDNRTTIINLYTAGPFIRIDYSKPLNLYWQSDLYSESHYSIEFTRDPSNKDDVTKNFDTKIFTTNINYKIRYLPDSRTSIGITVGGNYQNSSGERQAYDISGPVKGHMNDNYISFMGKLDMYYYFSPQLRITCYWSLNTFNDKSSTEIGSDSDYSMINSYFSNNFNIGFVYSFF
jgi:hypothetical protein